MSVKELTGMNDKELKQLNEAAIETLQNMGFKKYDAAMVAIMSVSILDMLGKYKKKVEKELQKATNQVMEKEFPKFLATLTEGVDYTIKKQKQNKQ